MSINKRRLDIIREIIIKNKISLDWALNKFKVSERTIRNDLILINSYLNKTSDNEIFIKNGFLIYENIDIFSDKLKGVNLNNYILDNDERITLSIYLLLLANDYMTTNYISDLLMVSQSSIFNDTNIIKNELGRYNLYLESSPGKGLLIRGKETDIRSLFYDIIDTKYYLINILENTCYDDYIIISYLDIKKYLYEIIGEVEHRHSIIFSEDSFNNLYNYLIYAIHRIRNKKTTDGFKLNGKIMNISKDIISLSEEKYKISINDSESSMIDKLIKSLEYKYIGKSVSNTIESQFLSRYIIDYVSEEINIPLFMDYTLYESLSFHLERIKNNNYFGDPIDYDEEILNLVINNKKLHDAVSKSLVNTDEYFKGLLTENEIYYIMIYLYISIERLINQIIKELKIVIVCNSGIGTSQLMSLKLKDLFGFKNIRNITSRQLDDSVIREADLILSTVRLPIKITDYVKVSPVITTKNATLITSLIFEIGKNKLREINNVNDSKLIFNSLDEKSAENLPTKGIDYYLTSENIFLDVEVENWRESIKFGGNILLKRNKINESYIDGMIQNIEDYGPYVVIKKGVALPHAEILSDEFDTSFLLLRLKKPIPYGVDKLDPIKYVCILVASQNKDHIKALFDFNNIVSNKKIMKRLDSAISPKEVESLIKEFIYEK